MRLFVTGATGVIGCRIVPLLVEEGHQVSALGRTDWKRAELARLGASPVALDLFDPPAVRHALAGQDVVVNLDPPAGVYHPDVSTRRLARE